MRVENIERQRRPVKNLVGDIIWNTVGGSALGYVYSWIWPTFIMQAKNIRYGSNNLIKLSHTAALLGYSLGIYNHITDIVKSPADWKSYLPVATNILAASYIAVRKIIKYNKNRRKPIEATEGELERVVS